MVGVVFVNHLPRGTASSYRQEGFARCLRKEGYETTLVCRAGGSAPVNAEGGDAAFGRTLHWVEPFPFRLASNARLLSSAIKGAAVIHINRANPYTATLLSLVRGSSGAAVVVDLEDWDGYGGYASYIGSHGPKGWALTGYERMFPRTADAVVVVSKLLHAYMLSVGVPREKLFLVHNGYDSALFGTDVDGREAREKYGLGDAPVVMYSSTFWEFERKQHEIAFAALRKIVDEVPHVRLLMTGRETSDFGGALAAGGIRERVVRPGFVPREMFPGLMATADVAVHVISNHPFHRASSPVIIPEYMAMGKAVVAPRVGELGEILGDGAGVLVDNVDSDLIASAAVGLLRDDGLRKEVGDRARAKAVRELSYEAGTAKLRQAYEKALS